MRPTPLPDLERELTKAARRLDRAAPRRVWWRHGWALLGITLVTAGVGVAAARVAHVGPFAYLDRFGAYNPKLAPATTITVEPDGDEPAWKAVAFINKIGQVCITGGPRDPRTNPNATPTKDHLNNPPNAGLTCAGGDEIAQSLVDPNWPGATFAGSTGLDGSPEVNMGRTDQDGKFIPASRDYPTRAVVYAVAATGLTPVVRWGASGEPVKMIPSTRHLRLRVDKSPEGLSKDEFAKVSTYPDQLDLVLWAAEVDYPKGVTQAQVAFPAELPPHGVDDATVEMISIDEMVRLDQKGRADGWHYQRGISRDPTPVTGPSAAQRSKIAAFARPRTSSDAVPKQQHSKFLTEFQRVRYGASRRLSIAGGGLERAWVMPGARRAEEEIPGKPNDLTCMAGATLLGDCKSDASSWRRPMVEAVLCGSMFAQGETFVWALAPPGTTRIELRRGGRTLERLGAAELLALRRQRTEQPDAIRWVTTSGAVTQRVPWPRTKVDRCGRKPPNYKVFRKDSAGGVMYAGGPNAPSARRP